MPRAVGQAVLRADRRRARAGAPRPGDRRAGHGDAGAAGLRRAARARLGGGRPPGAPVVLAAHLGDGAAAGERAPRRRGRAADTEHRGVAARPSSGRSRPRSWSCRTRCRRGSRRARCSTHGRSSRPGRLVMEKQFTKLVQAFADVADQLPGWRLRILGQGHQRPHLVRETRKRGLWDRVELPGSTTDMASEWGRASICALTSRAEGFPLGLQEAMAAGVPCVTFDCASGPREIVRHEVNGLLVAPESIAGMSAALLRLGTDDDLRRRLGAGALESAAEWDADVLAARWVEIFEAAIARRGRPASVRRPVGGARAGAARDAGVRRVRRDARSGPARSARRWPSRPPGPRPTSGWWCRRTRRGRRSWCCRWPPGTGSSRSSRRPTVPSYLSLRDPAANGWHERRGARPGAGLRPAPRPDVGGRARALAARRRPDRPTVGARPGLHRRGGVLGGGRRRAAGGADAATATRSGSPAASPP